MIITTADEIRAIEVREDEIGTPFRDLMELAGTACANELMAGQGPEAGPVAVLCGNGKNGGDGFVIARHLLEHGYDVSVLLAFGAPKAEDTIYNEGLARASGVPVFNWGDPAGEKALKTASLLVDCLFGIGFRGAANDLQTEVFEAMNEAPGEIVSIDVPSGVITDTGEVLGPAVRAAKTFAISTLKPLHVFYPGREYCGETSVLDIGILPASFEVATPTFHTLTDDEAEALLPSRPVTAHKNDAGHVLSLCGSYRMPGAACLAAGAALRAGAGLLTAAYPEPAYPAISAHLTEAMHLPLPATAEGQLATDGLRELFSFLPTATVLLAGCGLGQSHEVRMFLRGILEAADLPLVLDADALNSLSRDTDLLKAYKGPVVLTPHPGEMARLTGRPTSEVLADKVGCAKTFADTYGVTVLLKGADTVIASCERDDIFVNTTGNQGLAKGGSGDTLSGILAAFLAQGMAPFEAAVAAAFYHGKAADFCGNTASLRSMLATDLIAALPFVLPD